MVTIKFSKCDKYFMEFCKGLLKDSVDFSVEFLASGGAMVVISKSEEK